MIYECLPSRNESSPVCDSYYSKKTSIIICYFVQFQLTLLIIAGTLCLTKHIDSTWLTLNVRRLERLLICCVCNG